MTTQFINPLTKFTTADLQTLPYAILEFFENNSSTPKIVYEDKNKNTPHGTTVEAYADGTFPPIWLDGVYRVNLKNAAGVTQSPWPIDSVGAIYNYTAFSAWDSTFTYDTTTNTFVTGPDGKYYRSIQNPNLNKTPASNPAYWSQIYVVEVWNANKTYADNDIVTYDGKLYASNTAGNVGNTPPASQWDNLTFNNTVTGDFTVTGTISSASYRSAVRTTSKSIVSSTTFEKDTSLEIQNLATGTYKVSGLVIWEPNSAAASNGIKLRLSTSGVFYHCTYTGTVNSTLSNASAVDNIEQASSVAGIEIPPPAFSAQQSIRFEGFITISSATQDIWIDWAQKVSDATATKVSFGCVIAEKLA